MKDQYHETCWCMTRISAGLYITAGELHDEQQDKTLQMGMLAMPNKRPLVVFGGIVWCSGDYDSGDWGGCAQGDRSASQSCVCLIKRKPVFCMSFPYFFLQQI